MGFIRTCMSDKLPVECFGFCRQCWAKLNFQLDGKEKTVKQLREELTAIHYQWGCSLSDVRIFSIKNPKTGETKVIR